MQDAHTFPQDLDACHTLLRDQSAAIATLREELEKLRALLAAQARANRSEKRILSDPNQFLLPFESDEEFQAARAEAEAEAQAVVQTITYQREVRQQAKRREESFPAHLPRIERVVDVPAEAKACETHGERVLIGYDATETLVRKPAELYVLLTKYAKYACPQAPECGVASPERPTGLVEGHRYDTSVAATIIDDKWGMYIPVYRQQDSFSASGWMPRRSTLFNLVDQSAFVVTPFVDYLRRQVQADLGVGLDETSCRLLLPAEVPAPIVGDPKNARLIEKVLEARAKGEKSLLAKMWVYSGLHRAPYNVFDFRVSRHRDGPDEFLKNSRCIVQADCFSGNRSVVMRSDSRLVFAACWAHARRKVFEAQTHRQEADLLLRMIQALYDIEERAKELTWQDRQALRQSEAPRILTAIVNWLDSAPLKLVLPKSDFAQAVNYIRKHWPALQVYVTDGRIPIDNNSVERLMKQVALGRKAWLFVSNVPSGEQSAMMMSLVSSARRHDLHIWSYVKDVLDQLLAGCTDYHQLLPDVWKQSHPEAVRTYREEERRDKAERKSLRAANRRIRKS